MVSKPSAARLSALLAAALLASCVDVQAGPLQLWFSGDNPYSGGFAIPTRLSDSQWAGGAFGDLRFVAHFD